MSHGETTSTEQSPLAMRQAREQNIRQGLDPLAALPLSGAELEAQLETPSYLLLWIGLAVAALLYLIFPLAGIVVGLLSCVLRLAMLALFTTCE